MRTFQRFSRYCVEREKNRRQYKILIQSDLGKSRDLGRWARKYIVAHAFLNGWAHSEKKRRSIVKKTNSEIAVYEQVAEKQRVDD